MELQSSRSIVCPGGQGIGVKAAMRNYYHVNCSWNSNSKIMQ